MQQHRRTVDHFWSLSLNKAEWRANLIYSHLSNLQYFQSFLKPALSKPLRTVCHKSRVFHGKVAVFTAFSAKWPQLYGHQGSLQNVRLRPLCPLCFPYVQPREEKTLMNTTNRQAVRKTIKACDIFLTQL